MHFSDFRQTVVTVWDVLFQVLMSAFPLGLVAQLVFMIMVVFFMQQSHSDVLIFWIDTFCIGWALQNMLGNLTLQVKH